MLFPAAVREEILKGFLIQLRCVMRLRSGLEIQIYYLAITCSIYFLSLQQAGSDS